METDDLIVRLKEAKRESDELAAAFLARLAEIEQSLEALQREEDDIRMALRACGHLPAQETVSEIFASLEKGDLTLGLALLAVVQVAGQITAAAMISEFAQANKRITTSAIHLALYRFRGRGLIIRVDPKRGSAYRITAEGRAHLGRHR